jgi:hypothetical protein
MVCADPKRDMKRIAIATDFSDSPVGRYPQDSDFNGERFREEFLVPALEAEKLVTVNIDGAEGYGSSFLDEAFGGLVRNGHFSAFELSQRLTIECLDPDYTPYMGLIWRYINEAKVP